jgi:Holliday junction resolvasome RuvABC endonuclease subunit
MNVLAFDLGQHYGYAAHYEYSTIEIVHGHRKLKRKNRESEFYNDVQYLIAEYQPDFVVYENIKFSKTMAAGQAAGMWRGIVLAACQNAKVQTEGVPVGTWKLSLGKGNMNQEQYMAAVNRAYGLKVTDENEAAALGVLWWYMN